MASSMKHHLQNAVLGEGLRYVEKNPEENVLKLVRWLRPFAKIPRHKMILNYAEEVLQDPHSSWRQMVERAFTQLEPIVRRRFLSNFLLNANLLGIPARDKLTQEHDVGVPWAILMDPTSRCNMNCIGCWAKDYDRHADLELAELDRIVTEGKSLGIYMYLFSGGEPLLRASDIVYLARKHVDCMFLAFTNGSLVDEQLAADLAGVGNVLLAISVEGFSENNDRRRGAGSYDHTVRAMQLLRNAGVGFGFSTCYHRENTAEVVSDSFIDLMVEQGCFFGWYFTYVPLGEGDHASLLATPDQRRHMYDRVRKLRTEKPIFLMDFWNDGEYVHGCIAGGRTYMHINAHGDVEPCAFIHYSDVNIHDVSLWEALHSKLFRQYRLHQPFNDNHLRPCPLLDNPNALAAMVQKSGAVSTQRHNPESVETLTCKCHEPAAAWQPVADSLWADRQEQQKATEKVGV